MELKTLFNLYRNNLSRMNHDDSLVKNLESTKDWAFHTCGLKAYPENLENQCSLMNDYSSVIWDKKFDKIFYDFVINNNFDFKKLDNMLSKHKGLFLDQVLIDREILKNLRDENQSIIYRDYLEFFHPNISSQIHYLMKEPPFNDWTITANWDYGYSRPDPATRAKYFSEIGFVNFLRSYWKCDHYEKKSCNLCQKEFYPQAHYEWPGVSRPEYCGYCLQLAFHSGFGTFKYREPELNYQTLDLSKEEVLNNFKFGMKGFVEYTGFIPTARFTAKKLRNVSLVDMESEKADEYLMWWSVLPRPFFITQYFESWAHLLDYCDLLSGTKGKGQGGYRSIASDGHLCLSIPEREICEYLCRSNIEHEKEPFYPDVDNFEFGGMRADWRIGNTYFEFAGMMSIESYAEKMKKKIKLAKKYGVKLIVIQPKDLEKLEKIFEKAQKP